MDLNLAIILSAPLALYMLLNAVNNNKPKVVRSRRQVDMAQVPIRPPDPQSEKEPEEEEACCDECDNGEPCSGEKEQPEEPEEPQATSFPPTDE